MSNTYEWARETLDSARSIAAGKPVQHNTRLFQRDGGIAVRYHATDIVVYKQNGTYELYNNGWSTVTTLQRIRDYSPAKLFSVSGDWYLRLEPRDSDPYPERHDRTIPKPYEALDPGPEPVKTDDGCIAPRVEVHEHLASALIGNYRREVDLDAEPYQHYYSDGSGPAWRQAKVEQRGVFYGTARYGYNDPYWGEWAGLGRYSHTNSVVKDDIRIEYKQCPHCKAFDRMHDNWRHWYHGERYGRKPFYGYKVYAEMMRIYRTQEAWREAYLEDFRARRAFLKLEREWEQRNRVPFYDGIVINSDGYALRLRADGPSPAKLRRHERTVALIKKNIGKYADGFIRALKAGNMPMPSNGDCWYCLMHDSEGRAMGDIGDNAGERHLFGHMRERYYVPSLVINALRETGYGDAGIYMFLCMDPENGTMGGERIADDIIRRDIQKYMRRRLIPSAPTT